MAAYSSFVLSMQVAMHRSICKRQLRSDAWIVLRYNRSLLVSEFPDLLESCPNPFLSSRSFMSSYFLVEEMTTIRLRFLSLFSMCLGSRGFIFRFFMFRFRRFPFTLSPSRTTSTIRHFVFPHLRMFLLTYAVHLYAVPLYVYHLEVDQL